MTGAAVDVLVVDDNEDLLELAVRSLKRAGIAAAGAKSFAELDATLATERLRLILMDVQMPDLFGDDVASILRHERGVTATIVLYSSLDSEVLAGLATSAGVDGWIAKSQGIQHLVDEVRRLLAAHPA